ncbi:MAG TPA: DUF2267 domain-containing protein [Thermoanaerobaculia bacterium]|nr:DUF2267 domain-containing protein [Thermoanaerobaculia bacterium]
MSHTNVSNINESVHKTQLWLNELTETGVFEDQNQAYSGLRAVLQTLRDRLTVDEAVHLASELPMVVRGFYYEGWKPSSMPSSIETPDEFDERIRHHLSQGSNIDPRAATRAVFGLLSERISDGEIAHVRDVLPEEIRDLWPEASVER